MNKTFTYFLILSILFTSCVNIINRNKKPINKYSGWWIYGERLHIFKDELSLDEYILNFHKEDEKELVELYLSVTEMEYFPMETVFYGVLKQDTLYVEDFEITYIKGCDEN